MKNASVQQPHSMKPLPFPLSSRAYPDFLLHSSHRRHLCVVLPKENHMQLAEAATLDRKSGGAEGSAVPRTLRGNVFRQSCHCAFGPPKVMKNAFCPRPLSMEAPPSPCHLDRSAAQWRDLRFSALGPGNSPISTLYVVCYFIHCASMTMLSPLLTLIVKRSTCASPRAHPDRLRSSLTL